VGKLSVAVNGMQIGNAIYDQNQQDQAWIANQVFVPATSTSAGSPTLANYVEFNGLNIPSDGGSITLSDMFIANNPGINALQLVAVPEPATLGLMAIGGLGLLLIGRKRAVGRSV
jgi:hypothetical protein